LALTTILRNFDKSFARSQYNDQIGDIYYIEDSEKYFENGKFNSKKFNKETPDFI